MSPRRPNPSRLRRGQLSLVTCIVVLGMVVLLGFVGNAGHIVSLKVGTQNAADAIAFSNAQWQARGMNAITATNHLLGEATALVTIIEGLGGPEADVKIEDYPAQSEAVDKINQQLVKTAPIRGLPVYGVVPPITQADQKFLDFIVKFVSPTNKEKAKHKAFATIYDAKLTLKRDMTLRLTVKTVANLGFFVPPPWGYISAGIAWAAHLHSTVEIVKLGKEWFILEGLEIVARAAKPLKVDAIEKQLIPALAAHGDFIAGRKPGATTESKIPGIVNVALGDNLTHLGESYKVTAATFPRANTYRLPIELEPASGTTGSIDEPEWGSDVPAPPKMDSSFDDMKDDLNERKGKAKRRIAALEKDLRELDKQEADLNKRLAEDKDLTTEDRQAINDEKASIAKTREEKQKTLVKAKEDLAVMEKEERDMDETMKNISALPNTSGNLSVQHLPKQFLNQAEQRYSQWTRATHPYVDAFRAPILGMFRDQLEKSEAADHYIKWTNRYALVSVWKFRTGFRFFKQTEKSGMWRKDPSAKQLAMYVMKDSYAKSGLRKDRKGHEPWTLSTGAAKQQAEKMFTSIGMAHRKIEPLFSPSLYPVASDDGMTTFAQAIYYNGNEQQPAPIGAKQPLQAKLGWDTLNWDPAAATPEWGSPPSETGSKWPWEIFDGAQDAGTAKVKLNWQAKLMPVTKTRLQAAAADQVLGEMRNNLGLSAVLYDGMVTH